MFKKLKDLLFTKKIDIEKVQFDISRSHLSAGTVLLGLVLGIFLLIQTENAIFDIARFMDQPVCPLNYCEEMKIDEINEWFYSNTETRMEQTRRFGEIKQVSSFEKYPELEIPYNNTKTDFESLSKVREDIRQVEMERAGSRIEEGRALDIYEGQLIEEIATPKERLLRKVDVSNTLTSSLETNEKLDRKITELKTEEEKLFGIYKKSFAKLKTVHDESLEIYEAENKVFEFKLLLLQLLITVPLLLIGFFWYRRSKEKNSKYAVLPFILLGVGAITFLQVIVMYAESWIPYELIAKLFDWINELPFGRVISYYLVVVVGVAVIGIIIISLQQRLFSQQRIALRRLGKKECPYCALPLSLSHEFCPGCGGQIRTECPNCHNKTYKMFSSCQHCGKKQN